MVGDATVTFGEMLRRHRLAAGLTQEELAERAGTSAQGVRSLERGYRQTPRRDTVNLLAAALGLSDYERARLQSAAKRQSPPSPPTTSTRSHRAKLPPQPTPFIGRRTQVDAVEELLLQPQVRLLTLTGTGGTGKTRLALKVAEQVCDRFKDGVSFVGLASITDPELVIPTIAGGLDVTEAGSQPLVTALREHLRNKQILLLLDNFEQILVAAPVVAELLSAAPELKVLATSRAALRLSGEHEYSVPPLALPGRQHPIELAALSLYDAVALFIQRAQAAKPEFQVTNENAPAVAEICHRLDGLPLAIELAAARVKLLPPRAMLPRLGDRLALLTGGARDMPARQQTLRSTIDWSYSLLRAGEQSLFAQMGVFVGGCTLEATEKVCELEELDVLEGIGGLIDNSLLRQRDDSPAEPRFEMLETIREYALERLELAGERTAVQARHTRYYQDLSDRAFAGSRGAHQVEWLEILDQEHDNLRASLARALSEGDLDTFAAIAWGIWLYWYFHGHLSEGQRWMRQGLAQGTPMSEMARGRLLFIYGLFAVMLTNYAEAAPHLEESRDIFRQSGHVLGQAYATGGLGMVQINQGRAEQGLPLLEEGVSLHEAAGDGYGRAVLLASSSVGLRQLGYSGQAMQMAEQALALARRVGDHHSTYMALCNLGILAYIKGDHRRAQAPLAEALALSVEMMELGSVAYCLRALGMVASAGGHFERAIRLWGAAETVLGSGEPGTLPHVADQSLYEQSLVASRAQLDEDTWTTSWDEGRALTTDEAIACALSDATVP